MPALRSAALTLLLCALGGAGGWAASFTPLPMPWLLGSLASCAILTLAAPQALPAGYAFPMRFRVAFIGLIGLLIGAQVSPGMFARPVSLLLTLGAVALFVPLAFAANYAIFRRIGGFDRPTALFSAAPGGLIESITMGEAAGADLQRLITQQFLRVISVIALLPMGLALYEGHPVGSSAGMGGASPASPASDWALLAAALAAGLAAGRLLRLPAWQITGPLTLSAVLALSGLPLTLPRWLVLLSQVVIGTSLGMRFTGLSHVTLLHGAGLSLLSVSAMLAIGGALAFLLLPLAGQNFEVLLITFAPGGVNEMALIALSLQANPAFVTLHHVFRIVITVLALGWLRRRGAPTDL